MTTGLRNPKRLAWTAEGMLWAVANKRDELGGDLVPDYVPSGFIDGEGCARGQPVGVAVDARYGLLVADDVGNSVWRVSVK